MDQQRLDASGAHPGHQRLGERRLAGSLRTFEYDEKSVRHQSVMIPLVTPRSIPSAIIWLTRVISLSTLARATR